MNYVNRSKVEIKSEILKYIFYKFFYKYFYNFFFIYIKVSKDLSSKSAKHYQDNKERLIFLLKKKENKKR